jgi:cell division protein FtsA
MVDELDGIGAPVGMTGARLEVNVHIITGSQSSTHNIVACVNRAGVNVAETIVEQLAASESVLTADEKELGVALVDIGGGTTDIAIYERGSLWHTAVVGVGGDHFTNDIAVGLRTPVPHAEKIKRKCGCALSGMVQEDETMEVASVGGRKPRVMARRILSEILQPRAEEIFHLVWDEIRRAGYEKSLNSGIVLTGGGSILDGMPEIAEQIFDLPIRRGCPAGVGGLADHVNSPPRSGSRCTEPGTAPARWGERRLAQAHWFALPGGFAACSASSSDHGRATRPRGSDEWQTCTTGLRPTKPPTPGACACGSTKKPQWAPGSR